MPVKKGQRWSTVLGGQEEEKARRIREIRKKKKTVQLRGNWPLVAWHNSGGSELGSLSLCGAFQVIG